LEIDGVEEPEGKYILWEALGLPKDTISSRLCSARRDACRMNDDDFLSVINWAVHGISSWLVVDINQTVK
jgi:hypothetical protein